MRIFLSYSRADIEKAELIAANLKQAGHQVFFDRESIKAAEDFNRVIWGQIQKTDLFVFLISPNSVRPGAYTLTELSFAEKKWPNPERRVLAVVIEPTDLNEIPVYASICNILHPEGNLAAEVRATVRILQKGHRLRKFGRIAAIGAGLAVIGALAMVGYREYLEQRPLVAREKLVAMNAFNTEDFLQSATNGDVKLMELYLTAGMDPNASSEKYGYDGVTALMMAIQGGHSKVVGMLLDAGADANARARGGGTALSWAAGRGQDQIVRALLKAGADIDAVNDAFTRTADSRYLSTMRILLEHEVRQTAIDNAFVRAAGEADVELLRILLARVSDPSRAASDALVRAASEFKKGTSKPSEADRIETFAYLLEVGADANARDKDEFTPLIWVVYHQDPKLARLLLDNGANVDVRCKCSGILGGGWTPLTLAIKRSDHVLGEDATSIYSIIEMLLAKNADVNLATEGWKKRSTPLMLAASAGDMPLVRRLLDMGADVNAQNYYGYTTLLYAADNKEMVAALLASGADVNAGANPLLPIVRQDDYRSLEILLEAGADVNKPDSEGQTPLMAAAKEATADTVRLLLAAGARADDKDNMGRTAETFARRRQHDEIIGLLQNTKK